MFIMSEADLIFFMIILIPLALFITCAIYAVKYKKSKWTEKKHLYTAIICGVIGVTFIIAIAVIINVILSRTIINM